MSTKSDCWSLHWFRSNIWIISDMLRWNLSSRIRLLRSQLTELIAKSIVRWMVDMTDWWSLCLRMEMRISRIILRSQFLTLSWSHQIIIHLCPRIGILVLERIPSFGICYNISGLGTKWSRGIALNGLNIMRVIYFPKSRIGYFLRSWSKVRRIVLMPVIFLLRLKQRLHKQLRSTCLMQTFKSRWNLPKINKSTISF